MEEMSLSLYYNHQHNESEETITTRNEHSLQVISNQPGQEARQGPPDFDLKDDCFKR